jgi:DNA-binding transcriptional ArsR family regulator
MTARMPLHPTLWRTCRVLANRTRLQIFSWLAMHSDQSVSAVADGIKKPLPVVSQYLRALEARGLLSARRIGRRVQYRIEPALTGQIALELVVALRQTFQKDAQAIETVFKLATAFTHPRRIEIYRVLKSGPRNLAQIQIATGISPRALLRHLFKLQARGFVVLRRTQYSTVDCLGAFGRELARAAEE